MAIAALPSVAVQFLPEAIASFRKECPGVVFVVRDYGAPTLVADLLDGTADFAITARPAASEKVAFKPLMSDGFVLACRRDDPLAQEAHLPWTAFGTRPFIAIAPPSSVRLMTDEAFRREGLDIVPVCEAGSWALAGRLIRAGLGVSAIPRLTATLADRSDLGFVRLLPALNREIGILTVKGRTLPPASQQFLAYLVQHIGKVGLEPGRLPC